MALMSFRLIKHLAWLGKDFGPVPSSNPSPTPDFTPSSVFAIVPNLASTCAHAFFLPLSVPLPLHTFTQLTSAAGSVVLADYPPPHQSA